MTNSKQQEQADIVIVGTGMVGSLLAIVLAPYFDSMVLLDKVAHDVSREPNINSRPLSLNKTSVEALQKYQLWSLLDPYSTAIKQVHVSQNGYLGTTQFKAADYALEKLGAVVPADVLALTLLKTALNLPNVQFQQIEDMQSIAPQAEQPCITYRTAEGVKSIQATYVFGCDGSHSKVAECIGAESIKQGETLFALVCDIAQADLNHMAYERFTEQGTIALLPKINCSAGMVFTGTQQQVESLEQLDDADFQQTIQSFMGDRLPLNIEAKPRFKKTLESVKRDPLAKGCVLLLGNAARTLYPIAAQGFNLGLRDVMQLEAIMACAADVGEARPEQVIQTFLALRQEDQQATSQLTSRIGSIFEKNIKGFSHVRGAGLIGLDLLTPLKNKIADRALGVAGSVKRVLKLVADE
jgi:2-octaprenyl-6-methoxyphenol hydroxylase